MYRPMMSKKNMDCTSFCIFHQTITCNMEKSDAIPPCQLLQSGTVQATRSCPGFHPDGLRRHHQERLWGRGLHVTEYSARWRKTEKWCQTVTQKFKVSKLNHRNFQRINTESAGVEQGSSSVENFHGLKPLHLPLMFQKRRGESRSHLVT